MVTIIIIIIVSVSVCSWLRRRQGFEG